MTLTSAYTTVFIHILGSSKAAAEIISRSNHIVRDSSLGSPYEEREDSPAVGQPIGGGRKRSYEAAKCCYLIGYSAMMLSDNKKKKECMSGMNGIKRENRI